MAGQPPTMQAQKRIHIICFIACEKGRDVAGKLLGHAFFLANTLIKQIFAYQLNHGGGHNGERRDDNQQIGDYKFPAKGMKQAFNPCQ